MQQLATDLEEVEAHSVRADQVNDPLVRAIELLSGRDIALQVAIANLAAIVADLDPDPDPEDEKRMYPGPPTWN